MQDAWRAYVELALGLTEASKKKATKVAQRLIGKGGATAEQLQALAEDLVKTSTANREAITKLIRYELDRALGVVGLATAEEVSDLTARVRDLEQQLRETEARAATVPPALADVELSDEPTGPAGVPAVPAGPSRKAVAKRAVAQKAVAQKAVGKKAVGKKAVGKKAAPRKAAGRAEPAAPAKQDGSAKKGAPARKKIARQTRKAAKKAGGTASGQAASTGPGVAS